jgi:hypothetical protein
VWSPPPPPPACPVDEIYYEVRGKRESVLLSVTVVAFCGLPTGGDDDQDSRKERKVKITMLFCCRWNRPHRPT